MEREQKEGEFDEWLLGDMCDDLKNHSYILKALGELVVSSPLTGFVYGREGESESLNLRWGIQQIIDLYLDRQEKIVKQCLEKYNNFDLMHLLKAKNFLKFVEQGTFLDKVGETKSLKCAIEHLNTVIARGGEMKEEAEDVKKKCEERLKGK